MKTHHTNAKRGHARKAMLAFVAVASIAVGGLAAPAPADAGPGGEQIDLTLCSSPATVLEVCVDNSGLAVLAGHGYAVSDSLGTATIDLGGPRTGSDRIDLRRCDSPATVLENCVD